MNCGCGGDCCQDNNALLAGLMGEVQLGTYPINQLGYLVSGVTFSQGFILEWSDPYAWTYGGVSNAFIKEEIYGALNRSNAFAGFTVELKAGVFNAYWQIDGKTKVGFGSPQDLQDLIRGYIQTYVKSVKISQEYPLTINTYPRISTGGSGTSNPIGGGNASAGGGGNASAGGGGGGENVSTGANSGGGNTTTNPVPTLPNAQSRCDPGYTYRGWIHGCQPTECPPGETYKEGLLTAGCKAIGEKDKGFFDSIAEDLNLSLDEAKAVVVAGGALVAILLLRR